MLLKSVKTFLVLTVWLMTSLQACLQPVSPAQAIQTSPSFFVNAAGDTIHTINKAAETWKSELDPMAYYVLREKGTERAFSGIYHSTKTKGIYTCAGCGLPLFSSESKFDSGTGWPSFYTPLDAAHLREEVDHAYGMRRVEVLCHRCGDHLGHVFDDGPRPTGLRYCMNSVSLKLIPAK